MFLLSSSIDSESNSWNCLPRSECFRVFMLSCSEFCDLLWSSLLYPVLALVRFYSTPGLVLLLPSHKTSHLGVPRIMSEHNVVSSWETMNPSLLLMSFARVSPRIGDNRGKLVIKRLFSDNFTLGVTPRCRSWGNASLSSIPWVSGCSGPWCSPLLVLAQGFLWFSNIHWLALRNCNHGTKFFDVAFDIFLIFLRIWEFSSCRPRRSLQNLPKDSTDGNLSPNVSMGKRRAPRCGLSLACVRQQCHWRSEDPEFCLNVE